MNKIFMRIGPLFVAIVWSFIYNDYYGWNFLPQSSEELLCDGIFSILIAISLK